MRTTLGISDALLRELRRRAAVSGRPFRAVVEETLTCGLAVADKSGRTRRRFCVKPHALGLKPGFRGVSLNQIYDQVEAEAAARKP
jgi:hypothetical protein